MFSHAMFNHAVVPLSYLYWSRMRQTLLSAAFVCLVVYVAHFLPEVRFLHAVSKLGTKILPIFAFSLVSSWFIWSSSRNLIYSASTLPGYLKTAPISTEKLALLPLAGAMTLMAPICYLTLSATWSASLPSKIVIALLSSATFAWIQTISWQPFRHGFVKFLLTQLIAFTFLGISAYFIYTPATLLTTVPPVLIFMALGVVANFYVAKNVRSKPSVTLDNSASPRESANNRKFNDFGSARKAQQYFELKNKPWAMPLYFILLAIIPVGFKVLGAPEGINDGDLRKMTVIFACPLVILIPWGIGQGVINTPGQKGNEGVADFLMALPLSCLEFVKCKYRVATKSLLLFFIPYLSVGVWACSDNVVYYFEKLSAKFGIFLSTISIFAFLAVATIFTVLSYLSVFWYGFVASRIPSNNITVVICALAITLIGLNIQFDLFVTLWVDYRYVVYFIIYFFVGAKLLATALTIRWSLRHIENYLSYLAWILLLWVALFAAQATGLRLFITMPSSIYATMLAGIFLATPVLGLTLAPAAFGYCRHR